MSTTRRVLCTIAHGSHACLLEVTGPALERYAHRHGYELVIVDRRIAPSRPAAWEKIALLHELADAPGLVLWVDADALVLDHSPDIEARLDPSRFLHLVEHRIGGMRVPNTGVMAVQGGPRAAAFFERVWAKTGDVNHKWWENAAIMRLLGYRVEPPIGPVRMTTWRRHVGFLDTAWNSIPADPAPDPHIVHFPGWPLADRLDALRRASVAAQV